MLHKEMKMKIAIGMVIVALIAFYGGMKYGQRKSTSVSGSQFGRGLNTTGQRSMRATAGGGFTGGEIITKDANSITIKTRDGSTKIVLFSQSTEVQKSTSGTADDLAIGKQITVTGSANADGSLTAQSIQVRPPIPASTQTVPQNTTQY